MTTEEYNALVKAMNGSIWLGYDAEEDMLTEEGISARAQMPEPERKWLASWLIGEGWTKK